MVDSIVTSVEAMLTPLAKILSLAGNVADESLNISEALKGTRLPDVMKKLPLRNFRIGMTLLAMIPTITGGEAPSQKDFQKAGQVMETIIFGVQRQKAENLAQINAVPGIEQHQDVRAQVTETVRQLRPKFSDDISKVAFEIVLSNVIEPRTSPILHNLFPGDLQNPDFQKWAKELNLLVDFKSLYASPVMNDPAQLRALTEKMHNLYQSPEIQALQKLVGDTPLLFNYEVIFRAVNDGAYAQTHPGEIKQAAEFLLREGNLEAVVAVLRESNAKLHVEKLIGVLSPYVPVSVFEHAYGEKVKLPV